jgi:hypothetical protein
MEGAPVQLTPSDTKPEDNVYKGQGKDGSTVGYAALGKAQGYSSTLKVMVGLSSDMDKVLGIKVLYQAETPGLGTRIIEVPTTKTLWTMFFGGEKADAPVKDYRHNGRHHNHPRRGKGRARRHRQGTERRFRLFIIGHAAWRVKACAMQTHYNKHRKTPDSISTCRPESEDTE